MAFLVARNDLVGREHALFFKVGEQILVEVEAPMSELVTHFRVCGAIAAKIEVLMCGWEKSVLRIEACRVIIIVFAFIVGIVNRLKRLMIIRSARKVEIVLGGVIFLLARVA